jgi:hypothetical protein
MKYDNILLFLEQNKNVYKKSVIYDIDDTLIFNSGKPNHEIIQIYNFSKLLGYTIFIITAREGNRENMVSTVQQLLENNISGFKKIYFRPKNKLDIFNYKLLCRKNIQDNGYNTILSVGDMYWDIGKYGGLGLKI